MDNLEKKVLIIAHAPLAAATKSVIEHITGSVLPGVKAIDVEDSKDGIQASSLTIAKNIVEHDVKYIFVDVLGATPYNLVMEALAHRHDVRVVVGFNLPLLLKVFNSINKKLCIESCVMTGKNSIVLVVDGEKYASEKSDDHK